MRLAAKLILLFLAGIFLLVSFFAYATIESDRKLALLEHQQQAKVIAEALEQDPQLPSSSEFLDASINPYLAPLKIRSRIRVIELGTDTFETAFGKPPEIILKEQEITSIYRMDESGQKRFYTYLPLSTINSKESVERGLEISDADLGDTQRLRRSLVSSLLAFLGITTLSASIIWIGGLKMVGKPLNALTEKVHRIGQGDFSSPLTLNSNDELADLSHAINEMCDQLELQRKTIASESKSKIEALEQLRHSDRLTSVGQMAAGFAHEIGTPLNVVLGRAELIVSGALDVADVKKNAVTIKEESLRISKIVRSLLDFSRPQKPQRSLVSINQLASKTVDTTQPLATKQGVRIQINPLASDLTVSIDYAQIEQVFTNLLINGIHSIQGNGLIEINLLTQQKISPDNMGADSHQCIVIEFRDSGTGIPSEHLNQIFDPFFTTKTIGEGTGLGLAIAHGIVKEHLGWIEVQSTVGQGSTFRVYIPTDSTYNS
ncbi:ATP-binding protein [Rhodopirellula sp.]|nr:ATP-binding protein [Rhodopirellula sp.]